GRELLRAHAAGVEQLHGEAGRLAKAADRAGNESEHLRIAKPAERARRTLDDRVGAVLGSFAFVVIGEVEERLPGILSGSALAAAGDGEERLDVLAVGTVEEIAFDRELDLPRP